HVGRRADQQRVECRVRHALGLDFHAKRIGEAATRDGRDMDVVEAFAQHQVRRFESRKRREAECGEAVGHQQCDAKHRSLRNPVALRYMMHVMIQSILPASLVRTTALLWTGSFIESVVPSMSSA